MRVEKTFPQGAWQITAERQGDYVRRLYFFYTKKEAIAAFRSEFPLRKRGAK